MSKNFELLYQTGKAQEMLQAEVEQESSIPPLSEVDTSTPALEIDGMPREEVTKLIHRLFLLPGSEAPHHVVFAATESGSGCTWMCAHAAEILASQIGSSVCLVDCNFRAPSLHEQFKVENHSGLANALAGDVPIRQFAQQLSRRNLWLVTAGAVDDSSEKLLTSGRMRKRITELRSEFDYVLMDAAPVNTCNHSAIFGGWSDGVVLVLKA